MKVFPINPTEIFISSWRHRSLINETVKREVLSRYKGSLLGVGWSFVNPMLLLIVYTFVFSVVFKARWNNAISDSKTEFALILFAGLIIFNFFSECINKAPSIIVSNPNYVKKVIYPLEVLPIVILLSSFYHMVISLVVWVSAYLLLYGVPHITVFLFPFVILPLFILTLGLCWILASFGVFIRDISQIMGLLTTALLFLSPIFYSEESLPKEYQWVFFLNPLTPIVKFSRDILFFGKVPDVFTLCMMYFISIFTLVVGFVWFQKTRKGFADVL